jgi:signal transduction histidine kinase
VIADAFDLLIGTLEVALALIVLRHVWRFRGSSPWLMALIAFFLLRGLDRIFLGFADQEPATLGLLLDALLVAVLVLLLVAIERVVHGLELALDAARFREREYRRALVDYRRLVRHRLANPLSVIIGSVRALQELETNDPELRRELLENVGREAKRLESVSLDPHGELRAEESGLRPQPAGRSRRLA